VPSTIPIASIVADSAETTGLKWASPAGGFTFTTWSPSYTNLTIGNGTVTARYGYSGKYVIASWSLTWGSTTSQSGGTPTISLPSTAKNSLFVGAAWFLDAATAAYMGILTADSTTAFRLQNLRSANPIQISSFDSSAPFTWGNGDIMYATVCYEEA
jgi:hypothetical protein